MSAAIGNCNKASWPRSAWPSVQSIGVATGSIWTNIYFIPVSDSDATLWEVIWHVDGMRFDMKSSHGSALFSTYGALEVAKLNKPNANTRGNRSTPEIQDDGSQTGSYVVSWVWGEISTCVLRLWVVKFNGLVANVRSRRPMPEIYDVLLQNWNISDYLFPMLTKSPLISVISKT